MHARPIRSSLGPDPNGSAPVCTGPKSKLISGGGGHRNMSNLPSKDVVTRNVMESSSSTRASCKRKSPVLKSCILSFAINLAVLSSR